MPLTLRLHFARVLCLLMAVYLLNFSVDTPACDSNSSATSQSFAHKPAQIENLLGMALDVSITVEEEFPEKAEKENETETEVVDTLEFLPTHSQLPLSSVLLLHEHLLHLPATDLKTLYPEVNYLPPKTDHPSAVA